MRLRLVPEQTNIDFFRFARVTLGASVVAVILSIAAWLLIGLNFGIDFRGGTTIRTEANQPVDVAAYRAAVEAQNLGQVSISEVFDPSFRDDQYVAMIRIEAQEGQESATGEVIQAVEAALLAVEPSIKFTSVESAPTSPTRNTGGSGSARSSSTSGSGSSGSSPWAPSRP